MSSHSQSSDSSETTHLCMPPSESSDLEQNAVCEDQDPVHSLLSKLALSKSELTDGMLKRITELYEQSKSDNLLDSSALKSHIEDCTYLLEYIWEKLNTGHWKDVKLEWRYSYTIVSLAKALALTRTHGQHTSKDAAICELKSALRTCDMGLLMGAPITRPAAHSSLLSEMADNIHDKLNSVNPPSTNSDETEQPSIKYRRTDQIQVSSGQNIEITAAPSIVEFEQSYYKKETPVLMTGLASEWPCTKKWSVSYIKEVAGHRLVPVEVGSKYTEDNWGQQLMTIHQFSDKYFTPGPSTVPGYVAQHELFDQISVLGRDIVTPDYCYVTDSDRDVQVNAWFGPAGTVSPLHQDPRDNVFVQIFGSKLVILIDPKFTAQVYPHQTGMMTNTSQVDVESPDLDLYPEFANVEMKRMIVTGGDCVYIPRGWWHYLRGLQPSFSISYWFG